jgi:hypothetical protein
LAQSHPGAPLLDDWVPVERRWLGIDKRTIAPALIALILAIVVRGVLPAIDDAVDYDRQIQAGDVIDLGAGVTFVPPVGWGFPDGILVSDQSVGGTEEAAHLGAKLENGAITVSVTTGPFDGTPEQLLQNILKLNETYKSIDNSKTSTDSSTLTTSSGITGVGQGYAGVNVEGVLAAFVVDGIGIEFVVQATSETLLANAETISDMIDSLTYTKPEAAS